MKIVEIEISKLKPYNKNARKHGEKQIDLLCKNIERFGFTVPILIDKDNEIIAGHGRLMALQRLNWEKAPCVKMEGLTPQEIKALRISDNKLAELAEWDMDLLLPELKELGEDEFELTGFDKDLIIEPDEKDDEVPEIPKTPRSKLGDLYELGRHRLLCADSTQQEAALRLMNDNKADMVFTDPPYNVDYSERGENTSTKILNDNMSSSAFDSFLLDVFKNYNSVSKTGAGWYVFHSSSTQHQFQNAIERNGWKVKNQIIWNKPVASMGWGDYRWKHEPMFYCGKENTQFYGNRTHTTILDIPEDNEKALKWIRKQKEYDKLGYNTIWSMKR